MADQKIKDYVMTEHARGVDTEAIRSALLAQGWNEADVSETIRLCMIEKGWGVGGTTTGNSAVSSVSVSGGEGLFKGRLGKKKYLHIVLVGIAVTIVAGAFFGFSFMPWMDPNNMLTRGPSMMHIGLTVVIFAAIGLTYGIMQLGATVRRLHDIGHSGWWVLLSFINIINLIMLVYLCVKDGDAGGNTYGNPSDPNVTLWQALKGSK